MTLRSVFSRRTTSDAVRRMKAVLGILDHDLTELAAQLTEPIPERALSDVEWRTAETARAAVEQDLRQLEAEAAVVATQVSDWQSKAAMAAQRGHGQLAEQARVRAAEADEVYRSYGQEIDSVRIFLHEWSVRVRRADP
jgi:hypothetical protein